LGRDDLVADDTEKWGKVIRAANICVMAAFSVKSLIESSRPDPYAVLVQERLIRRRLLGVNCLIHLGISLYPATGFGLDACPRLMLPGKKLP